MVHESVNRWLATFYLTSGIICMTSVTIVAWKLWSRL